MGIIACIATCEGRLQINAMCTYYRNFIVHSRTRNKFTVAMLFIYLFLFKVNNEN